MNGRKAQYAGSRLRGYFGAFSRRGRESNAPGRLCRPLPSHSATPPDGEPYLLMAVRRFESEPVLIDTTGARVLLMLDDGDVLDFDRLELLAALGGGPHRT